MTLTKQADCSDITLSSTILTNFATYSSVNLKYTVNGGTEVTYAVLVGDITSGTMTLDPTFFTQGTTTLCDGIYCFTLEATSGSTVTKEYGQVFVDCAMACALAEKLWNNPEDLTYSKFEAIKLYAGCNSCDCATTYSLYYDLLCELGLSTNLCGCT